MTEYSTMAFTAPLSTCLLLLVVFFLTFEYGRSLQQPAKLTTPKSSSAGSTFANKPNSGPLKASSIAETTFPASSGVAESETFDPVDVASLLQRRVYRRFHIVPTTAVSIPSQDTSSGSSTTTSTTTTSNSNVAIWKLALAGALATLVSDVAMHPLDGIKTLQQSEEGMGLSMMESVHVIYAQLGGLSGFYKGFLTYGLCDAVGGALKFSTYERLKREAESRMADTTSSDEDASSSGTAGFQSLLFLFAGLAFVASSVITVPGELLEQQLQMGHYLDVWAALSDILEAKGLAGLYQGYDAVFLRDVPYTAMELGLYDLFKGLYVSRREQWQEDRRLLPSDDRVPSEASGELPLQTIEQLALAGLTGGVAGFVTTPLDTVKTKLMVDAHFAGLDFWEATILTIHDHGLPALFCGAMARVAWLVPATAIYLPAYDFIKNRIEQEQTR